MWGLGTDELIYKAEIESWCRKHVYGYQGEKQGRNWEIGINIYIVLNVK